MKKLLIGVVLGAFAVAGLAACPAVPYDLMAGMYIDVGEVLVWNDAEFLYVQYVVDGPWVLTEAHLGVSAQPFTGRVPPGLLPYFSAAGYFRIPVADLPPSEDPCGATLYLQAHAVVVQYGDDGEIIADQTAYGGEITKPRKGSWYGNLAYVWCCNGGDEDELCWEGETAWADGARYMTSGNWAMYVNYDGTAKTVDLMAGQHHLAGTVYFSAPDGGFVTITITLNDGWRFALVEENVKIQDYAVAPSGNPNPGGFAHKGTASGQLFTISVPVNNFYGVHVDVDWSYICTP